MPFRCRAYSYKVKKEKNSEPHAIRTFRFSQYNDINLLKMYTKFVMIKTIRVWRCLLWKLQLWEQECLDYLVL